MRNKIRLLISVKEARKLLGVHAKNLTDEEIKGLVIDAEHLARFSIQQYLVRKSDMLK